MTESNVQPFEFRGNPVATVTAENGTVLFCAKHVATALGYKRPADAVKQHCKGSVIRRPLETAGGIQQMVFICWIPQEVIDYRDRRCAISRKELVYGE